CHPHADVEHVLGAVEYGDSPVQEHPAQFGVVVARFDEAAHPGVAGQVPGLLRFGVRPEDDAAFVEAVEHGHQVGGAVGVDGGELELPSLFHERGDLSLGHGDAGTLFHAASRTGSTKPGKGWPEQYSVPLGCWA